MDPIDDDLARIAELKCLDETKDGVIPVAALSDGLREVFEGAHIAAACPVIDGQVCIQPADWARFWHRQEQEVMQRMRMRSLEVAARGPAPGDLAQAPVLSHWIAVEGGASSGAVLMGSAPDHPICVGTLIMTSRLCGIAEDASWARTISRWYRLEHPATHEAFLERNGRKISAVSSAPLKLWQVRAIAAREQEDLETW